MSKPSAEASALGFFDCVGHDLDRGMRLRLDLHHMRITCLRCHDFWSKSLSWRADEIERENGVFCRSRQDLHGVILR